MKAQHVCDISLPICVVTGCRSCSLAELSLPVDCGSIYSLSSLELSMRVQQCSLDLPAAPLTLLCRQEAAFHPPRAFAGTLLTSRAWAAPGMPALVTCAAPCTWCRSTCPGGPSRYGAVSCEGCWGAHGGGDPQGDVQCCLRPAGLLMECSR